MFNVGPLELMVILVVALLVVGPSKLPEVGRSIGRGLREFRRAQDEVQRTLRLSLDDEEPPSHPMRGVPDAQGPAETDGGADVSASGSRAGPDAETAAQRTDAQEVAKALGRGLAELRRAKEELQNSFRVDLGDDGGNGSRAR